MTEWEYIQIYIGNNEFAISSAQGAFFTDDEYKSIDPKGHMFEGVWKSGMEETRLMLTPLNKLGAEGWEAVESLYASRVTAHLLPKRPLSK
jgi:hypothetical protein